MRNMRRSSIALVAALAALALGVGGSASGAPPATPTFGANLVLPSSGGTGEPSIRTAPDGRSYVIAPTGVPAGCKAWRVTHDGSAGTFLGFPDGTAGGGDCDWAIGPQETGTTAPDLAYSSLTLPNITVGKSNDNGATFTPPNAWSQQVAGDDRMWMAADPKLNSLGFGTIYMTYHDVSAGEIELGVSTDGGVTYVQNSPLIDPTVVPTPQWSGAVDGNELGNIVARRDAAGALTLYSIFETPDSPADAAAQAAAQTNNFNRVYEAVGTVSGPDAAPVVTWHDYEIWHGPVGARLNRIFPVTAVDSAGHVYAVFADGNHVYFKSSVDGATWDPAAAPTKIDEVASGYVGNTALMPWVVAGGDGMVDVVWYGATGGAGAQPSPNDDPNNQWQVWLAQTVDGGASWVAARASDHVIHTGSICIDGLSCNTSVPARDRTLLDFFQVDLDPTNGAATIAFADDSKSPGSAVTVFTRQCTGTSATTGAALVDDCMAPPQPAALPQGTTCPGPQVVDPTGDAPNAYPGGDGSNIDSLDIASASFAPGAGGALKVTLTLKDLNGPPPPANLPAGLWRVNWSFGGTDYAVEADSNGGAANAFSVGTVDSSGYNPTATVDGSYNAGPNGTITWTVPASDVGNPGAADTLTNTSAETHGAIEGAGTGAFYTANADRAPNTGFGSDVKVGGCPAGTPSSAPTAGPSFTGPTTMPGSTDGNEPSLAVSTTGTRYVSWQSPGTFASSPDGVTFTNIGQPDSSALGDVTNAVDATGAVYNAQICGPPAALHTCVYRSTDGGHTWPQQTIAADSHPGASDRPWIDVYPRTGAEASPDTTRVYLEYHTFSPEDLAYVTVSTDGGKTFSEPKMITTDTNAVDASGCNTVPGGIAVDQRNGWVYALWLSGNEVVTNATTGCNYSQIGPFDKAWVSVSKDGGQTWSSHLAWQGAFDSSTRTGDNANKIFATITVDSAGQVHAGLPVRHHDDPMGFVTACETGGTCAETPSSTDFELVTSPDAGEHWTPPFTVNAGPGSNFFPWIAAGSRGTVDAVYYTSSTLQPNDPASTWYVDFARITGAAAVVDATGAGASYESTPQVAVTRLDGSPVHVGGICSFGIFCSAVPNADRDLADAIVLQLDPGGGANAAWTNDFGGASHVDFACQSAGASAFAGSPDLAGCWPPSSGPAGGSGAGSGAGGGGSSSGGAGGGSSGGGGSTTPAPTTTTPPTPAAPPASGGGVKGATKTTTHTVLLHGTVRASVTLSTARAWVNRKSVSYVDTKTGLRFRSTKVTSLAIRGHSATLRGIGMRNGVKGVRFRVVLVADARTVHVWFGRYVRSGRVVSGTLIVR